MDVKPSSDYISKIRFFTHEKTKEIVYAYVEGDDDIPFWTYALTKFSNEKYQFRVETNKMAARKDSASLESNPDNVINDSNGKAVLLTMTGLGKYKIACVDADFDLIIENYSPFTSIVRTNSFVFNTIYYSVENVLGSPQFRYDLLKKLHIKEFGKQLDEYIKMFSNYCRPLLILCIGIAASDNNKVKWTGYLNKGIPLVLSNIDKQISESENKEMLESKFPEEFSKLQSCFDSYDKTLLDNNISAEDSWKIIRGHNFFNSCILKILSKHIKSNINQKISQFATNYKKSATDKKQAIANYKYKVHCQWSPTTLECIKHTFYHNTPLTPWLPPQLASKIQAIYR